MHHRRRQPLARCRSLPFIIEDRADMGIKGRSGLSGQKGRIGDEFRMPFPAQVITAQLPGIVALAGIGLRTAIARHQIGQMAHVIAQFTQRCRAQRLEGQIGHRAGRCDARGRTGVKLVHQIKALRMIVDLSHADMLTRSGACTITNL